jgi:alkaline phosphatase
MQKNQLESSQTRELLTQHQRVLLHTAQTEIGESDSDMKKYPNASKCADIAKQLIRESPGKNFNVIFGGGRTKFLSVGGDRSDGLNLIDELINENKTLIKNRDEFLKLKISQTDQVLGLFGDDHLDYQLNASSTQPTLKEMTKSAIEILKKNQKGFFLLVEGGRIDQAHHSNFAKLLRKALALDETFEFSEAIRAAMEMTDEQDTLIIVTSDHSHSMTSNGYSKRGENILGLNSEISDIDKMTYTTISYSNGPSGGKMRHNMTKEELSRGSVRGYGYGYYPDIRHHYPYPGIRHFNKISG